MKKFGKLCVIGLAVITLAGCGKVATLENGEEAVVKTTDSGISANELYKVLKEKYGTSVLVDMIDKLILGAKYESSSEETAYINEQIESIKSTATQNNTTYAYMLSYYGFENEAALKDYLSLSYKRDKAVKDYLKENLTDKEIDAYYNDSVFGDINAKHILIAPKTTSDMTDAQKTAAKKEAYNTALEVIKKLNDGSAWDDLAKEYSDDTSNASKGGDLGWFSAGDMLTEFEKAARALEKGKYSTTPVETSYGYHIIFKVDEKDKPSKEDSLDTIKETLATNKLNADNSLYYTTIEKVRKDAGLSFEDDDLSSDYNTYMKNLISSASAN